MVRNVSSSSAGTAGKLGGTRASALRLTLATVLAAVVTLSEIAPALAAGTSSDGARHEAGQQTVERPAGSSLDHVTDAIGATVLHRRGITGKGVGVALIDSGTVAVGGLARTEVVAGPDLSFEAGDDELRSLDTYGHGTHMAGIIAANGHGATGVAPGARLISLKVAQADGMTDVSQVIAAIDWVVQHRNDAGMNIRVLNLSFGTDSLQDYEIDPLAHAVEVAWRSGIVVVVAAGNAGSDARSLDNPATDPYVLAVGAADTRGTRSPADDRVAEFSSRGTAARHADLLAPGKSIESLRVPGSFLDQRHPEGQVGAKWFRGSGTSQAAAAVSGAAALLLQERPELTADQVKALLTRTARRLRGADPLLAGAGLVDVRGAIGARRVASASQTWPTSTGTGSLEAARGGSHVVIDGAELIGEEDLFGTWDAAAWARAAEDGTSWEGTDWTSARWRGHDWSSARWRADTWSSARWRAAGWTSARWRGDTWSSARWRNDGWTSARWRSVQL